MGCARQPSATARPKRPSAPEETEQHGGSGIPGQRRGLEARVCSSAAPPLTDPATFSQSFCASVSSCAWPGVVTELHVQASFRASQHTDGCQCAGGCPSCAGAANS